MSEQEQDSSLTVAELIDVLKAMPQDMNVWCHVECGYVREGVTGAQINTKCGYTDRGVVMLDTTGI